MAKVEIMPSLYEEISKKFKGESVKILKNLKSLDQQPKKGKLLGEVAGIVIKELKYKNFRFYFLADGFKLRAYSQEELTDLLLRFVRMSDKKHQEQTIAEIKEILLKIGPGGFE